MLAKKSLDRSQPGFIFNYFLKIYSSKEITAIKVREKVRDLPFSMSDIRAEWNFLNPKLIFALHRN